MKSRITLLLAAVVVLAFGACSTEITDEKPRPVVELLSVKIGNLDVSGIPEPVFDTAWDDGDFQVATADFGTFVVKKDAEIEDVKITTTATAGARVRWGIASGGNRPNNFEDIRVNATFTTDDFLYFKVTAEDGKTTNYYRFYPVEAMTVKELVTVNVAGRGLVDKVPTPTTDIDKLVGYTDEDGNEVAGLIQKPEYQGRIDITMVEMLNARVEAEPQDANATIRFAVAPSLAAAKDISAWKNTIKEIVIDENEKEVTRAIANQPFIDGNYLIVEVAAENEDTNYYAFLITAGRMATISSLTFDGALVSNIGTPHETWGGALPGNYASADQKTGGFSFSIVLDDPASSCGFVILKDTGAAQPAATAYNPLYPTPDTTPKGEFADKQVLALRVRSALGTQYKYYKVEINLLAANIKEHPKSDYYYYYDANTLIDGTLNWYEYINLTVDPNHENFTTKGVSTIKELSVKPDREGNFTYQWYEANSWYGGYGFDADGYILYYKTGETTPTKEAGFGEKDYPGYENATKDDYPNADNPKDPYHQGHFDEKRNVSLHNGGNSFYNLPISGRPIPGATGPTYKPEIHYRPFIAGFTNEFHYYWVVITDDEGRKVTSQRATIISERDPTKKHHIVDLTAYLDESGNTPGLQGNPRNINPFTKGNHGDKYVIPMTFPDDFDVMDYSVVTCQALFYLSDGRPWIQNWTQGDFGFEKEGVKLVLWYNITADNATRGLQSSGNDPAGGGLAEIPDGLIVQPAGTKPLRELPPFTGNKDVLDRDIPEARPAFGGGDAQGWFTPYIEICEIRFEGPSRK